jgi:hypothetical protein
MGYVFMTNHVHLIAAAQNGNLSDLVRDFKKYTAYKILETIHIYIRIPFAPDGWKGKKIMFTAAPEC